MDYITSDKKKQDPSRIVGDFLRSRWREGRGQCYNMLMLALDFIQWWYLRGWGIYFNSLMHRIHSTLEFFSIGLLLKTLFQPFRQISANDTSGRTDPGSVFNAIIDNLLSRTIGFFVRVGIIAIGCILTLLEVIFGFLLAVAWPLIPLLPVLGLVLSLSGVNFGSLR